MCTYKFIFVIDDGLKKNKQEHLSLARILCLVQNLLLSQITNGTLFIGPV